MQKHRVAVGLVDSIDQSIALFATSAEKTEQKKRISNQFSTFSAIQQFDVELIGSPTSTMKNGRAAELNY